MEQLQAILDSINDILWSNALIILLLASGVYYTIRLNFAQFTKIPLMIKYMFEENTSGTGRTSFQAFALTLSTRVGTGNIAGVATAIALGFCTPGVQAGPAFVQHGLDTSLAGFGSPFVAIAMFFFASLLSGMGPGRCGNGRLSWFNLIAMLLLSSGAIKAYKDFIEQYNATGDATFHPKKLGIKNTDDDVWEG